MMWQKNLLMAAKRKENRQKNFLIELEKLLSINKPIFVDRSLIEWKKIERQTGIKVWEIKEENLAKASDIRAENIIGRYKITTKNSNNIWEIWIDVDCNKNIEHRSILEDNFHKLKEATLEVIKTLVWFGIPEECILIKSSGRGFHITVFVVGLKGESQYQQVMDAICEKTGLPNVKTSDYRQLEDYVFGLDKATLCKTRTKIREYGGCNDKIRGIFHYCSYLDKKKFKKIRKYPLVQDQNKVQYPPIQIFKVTNKFIRKIHQVNTDRLTSQFRETGKVVYDLDGEVLELYNCPLIKKLVQNAQKNKHLTNVERVFLSQLFPFFGKKGEEELHKIMRHCADYDERYTQYQIDAMKRSNRKPITCEWANRNIGCLECRGVAGKSPIKLAWKPKTLDEVKEVFQKWLYMKTPLGETDLEAIDIILAIACDRQVAGDPIWLWLVAPSGCSKTTFITSLKNWKVYPLDKWTPQTLVSGMVMRDRKTGRMEKVKGILKQLDGKILTVKDFTTILQMKAEYRNAIFGQLRAAYDGYFEAGFGTMKEPIRVESSFGVIAGVTPVIDVYGTLMALLGERFLKLRIFYDRIETLKKAKQQLGKEKEMQRELQKAVYSFLKNLDFSYEIEIPAKYDEKLINLALLVAQLRTPVWKRGYAIGEFISTTEYATRLMKQLTKLLMLIAYVRNKKTVEDEDFNAILRVGLNTPPIERSLVLLWLYNNEEGGITEMSEQIAGLTYRIVQRALEEMEAISDLVVREEDAWRLHPSSLQHLDCVYPRHYGIKGYTSILNNKQSKNKFKTHTPLSDYVVDSQHHRKRSPAVDIDDALSGKMWRKKRKDDNV